VTRAGPEGSTTRLADERGFTLIEVLLVSTLLIVVLGAILSMLDTTSRVSARDQERPIAIREGQVGLYRMTRELRQATQLYSLTDYRAEVQVTVGGVAQRVLYACDVTPAGSSYRQCTRAASTNLSAALSPGTTAVVERLQNGTSADPVDPVFTLSSSSYAKVSLLVPENPEWAGDSRRSTAFKDGFYMRNLGTL